MGTFKTVCRNGHAKGPGKCLICARARIRDWQRRNAARMKENSRTWKENNLEKYSEQRRNQRLRYYKSEKGKAAYQRKLVMEREKRRLARGGKPASNRKGQFESACKMGHAKGPGRCKVCKTDGHRLWCRNNRDYVNNLNRRYSSDPEVKARRKIKNKKFKSRRKQTKNLFGLLALSDAVNQQQNKTNE